MSANTEYSTFGSIPTEQMNALLGMDVKNVENLAKKATDLTALAKKKTALLALAEHADELIALIGKKGK